MKVICLSILLLFSSAVLFPQENEKRQEIDSIGILKEIKALADQKQKLAEGINRLNEAVEIRRALIAMVRDTAIQLGYRIDSLRVFVLEQEKLYGPSTGRKQLLTGLDSLKKNAEHKLNGFEEQITLWRKDYEEELALISQAKTLIKEIDTAIVRLQIKLLGK